MPTDMHQLPREEFIERNLGLVHACAGRFKGRGIEYEELYAAGSGVCEGPATGLIPGAASAFPPMPCRSSWARSKSCSEMAAQSRSAVR